MSDVNWANAVSMVATADGLLVTERGADGQVGATPMQRLLQQTAVRQPTAWEKSTYSLVPLPNAKVLTKPGAATTSGPAIMIFEGTEAEALNLAQSKQWPGYCFLLFRWGYIAATGGYQKLIWSGCPRRFLFVDEALAGISGVPEEGGDLGASPRPGFRAPTQVYPQAPTLYRDNETMMTCTDSALKTYRFIVAQKGFVREVNDVMAGKQPKTGRYMMPFKACSDADAWGVLFSPYTVFDEALCWHLERLDAKPGYASSWTLVKTLNC